MYVYAPVQSVGYNELYLMDLSNNSLQYQLLSILNNIIDSKKIATGLDFSE